MEPGKNNSSSHLITEHRFHILVVNYLIVSCTLVKQN